MSLSEAMDRKYTKATSIFSNKRYNGKLAELLASGSQQITFLHDDQVAAIVASFVIGRMNGYVFGLIKAASIIVVASLIILIFIDFNYDVLSLSSRAAHWTATSLTALATVMLLAYPYTAKVERINAVLKTKGLRFIDNSRGQILLYNEETVPQYQILNLPGVSQF